MRVELINQGVFPLLNVEIADRFFPQDMLPKEVIVPKDIRPRRRLEVAYRAVCFRHRGQYKVGPLEVFFYDPMGLYRRRRRFPKEEPFTVLPKPLPLSRIGLDGRSILLSSFMPDRQTRGESLKFYGIREYRPGDPLRFVHWTSSARLGELVVRQFEANVSAQVTIFLDLARRSLSGLGAEATVEYVIRTACAIAAAAVAEGHEVQMFGEEEKSLVTPLAGGETHLGHILEKLALVKPKGKTPFHEVISRYADRIPQGSQVFLIAASVAGDPSDFAESVAFLKGRNTRVQALLVDDRTFIQHDRWKRDLGGEAFPPLARFLVGNGIEVRLIPKGTDLTIKLGERGG